jgi:predicted lactoylglutathione lyase
MRPKIHCISLPVVDLRRAVEFYRDGLGLDIPPDAELTDHYPIPLEDGAYLVPIVQPEFDAFLRMAAMDVPTPGISSVILTHFCATREDVDKILAQAEAAGGRMTPAQDRAWGYSGFVADPDGHLWEIMQNPGV